MKVLDYFTAKPARFFLLAAMVWGGLMCYLNYKDGTNFSWHDLLVEANGMFFDLLVFGVLLYAYEAWRDKKEKIQRLHEEIDDYRGWDEKEAMYRIVGAVKRLNKLGVSKMDLHSCYLMGAGLAFENLQGASFTWANLSKAHLQRANLTGAEFTWADLTNANLQGTNFTSANLMEANLSEAVLIRANFQEATLLGANLQGAFFTSNSLVNGKPYEATFIRANLQEANLQGAEVGKGWFEKLEEWEVIGREEIIEHYLIDENGKLKPKY